MDCCIHQHLEMTHVEMEEQNEQYKPSNKAYGEFYMELKKAMRCGHGRHEI